MGGEHMGSMGYYGGYGISLGTMISGLLVILIKLLMFVFVIAVVTGIFLWIKNNLFTNTNSKFLQSINKDPLLKNISIVTIIIIGIILIFSLFSGMNQPNMGFGGHAGIMGFSPLYSIVGLLSLLVKVLMFVLIISLILAAASYIKNQYDQGNLNFFGTNKNQGGNTGTTESQSSDNNT